MSYFSVAIAISLGYDEIEATRVGTLAMLGDVSLLNHPEWFDENHQVRSSAFSSVEIRIVLWKVRQSSNRIWILTKSSLNLYLRSTNCPTDQDIPTD